MSDPYSVVYSPEALNDLKDIYAYLAYELLVPDTAQDQVNRIRKAIRSLSFNLFRAGCIETFVPSEEKEMEAVSWAFDVYDRAMSDVSFSQCTVLGKMTALPLFCREICSFRSSCDTVIFSKGSDLLRKLKESS